MGRFVGLLSIVPNTTSLLAMAFAGTAGETFAGDPNSMFADWRTDSQLNLPGRASNYEVQVAHGTDIDAYIRAVHAADPGLTAIVMMMASMATLGVIGGLLGVPIGVIAHRLIVPRMVGPVLRNE
jgi:hypothetical protein